MRKNVFCQQKEADAYDKMLDLAEVLNDWLVASPLEMDDVQRDTMAMWLAERKEALQHILRVGRLPEQETPAQDASAPSATAETSPAGDDAVPAAKARKPGQPERWRSVTGRSAPMLPSHVPLRIFSHI